MAAVLVNAALGSSVAQATPANFTLNFATSTGTPGVGDLIMVAVSIRGTAGTVATPSGWTAVTGNPFQYTSNASRMYLFYRVRQAGDANSVSFTVTGGTTNNTLLAQAYYFGGVDPTTPIEVNPVKTDQASSATTVAATGVTTLNANALGVAFFHRADDAGTWAAANSWTVNNATNARPASTLGSDASMGMATKAMPTAGATSAPTLTVTSGAAAVGMSVVLALRAQTGSGLVTMDAEGGTDEVTPTAQSAATPTIAIVVGTATTVVDTAFAATNGGGTKSFRHTVSTTTQGRVKCNADIPSTRQYGAFVGRVGARPTANVRMASLEAYDGTDWAQVQMNASGQIRLASDGAANVTASSTTTFAANEEFRIEWLYNNGSVELRIFKGADLGDDVSTPTETITASGWPAGTVGRGMFGNGTAWGVATGLWYDNCSVREDNWVNLKASGTTAAAGSASATVAGQAATKQVRPTAQAPAATVTGQTPSKEVRVSAGLASVGVAGQGATASTAGGGTTVVAGAAAVTVTAHAPTVTRTGEPDAAAATVTVVGHAPNASVRPTATAGAVSTLGQPAQGQVRVSAGVASVGVAGQGAGTTRTGEPDATAATLTVAGQTPSKQVRVNAGVASVTVTGQNATAVTATATVATAGVASLTVAAQTPTGQVRTTAGVGTAAAAAQPPQRRVTATPTAATATVAGQTATGRATVVGAAATATLAVTAQPATTARTGEPDAATATVTVTAHAPTRQVQPAAPAATLTVTALNATVATAAVTTAAAGAATVGVVAHPPAGQVRASSTTAAGTVLGQTGQGRVTATAGAATATVVGQGATGRATVVGAAGTATLSVVGQAAGTTRTGEPDPTAAAATVTAHAPTAAVQSSPTTATATATALNATVSTSAATVATAGVATVGLVAHNPATTRTGEPDPTVATLTVQAQAPKGAVQATAGVASVTVAGQAITPRVAPTPLGKPQQWSNGYLLTDATGWGGTAYDPATTYNGHGTMRVAAGGTTITGPWFSPIEPGRIYRASAVMKSDVAAGNMYWGLQYRDRDTFALGPSTNYIPNLNTLTTLAVDLKNGDTTATVVDASQWSAAAGRYFAVWGHSDSAGKKWPSNTYTRLIATMASPYVTGNVITLNAAWSGGTVRAGTPVGQTVSAGTYLYFGNIGGTPPLDWVRHEVTIDGSSPAGAWNNPTKIPLGGYEVRFIGLNLSNPTGQFWVAEAELLEVGPPTSVLVSWDPKASIRPSGVEHAAISVQAQPATVTASSTVAAGAASATIAGLNATVSTSAAATAPAAAATSTVTAANPTVSVRGTATAATATVVGQAAQDRVTVTAGAGSAGLVAHAPTGRPTVVAAAQSATILLSAQNPGGVRTGEPDPTTATAAITAQPATGTVRSSAGQPTATVAGQPAQGQVRASAGAATWQVQAQPATVSTAGQTFAQAGTATITTTGHTATVTASGAATATAATVTVTAHAPSRAVTPRAGAGTAAVASNAGTGQVRATAGVAAVTAAANAATVTVSGNTTATAGTAPITATAHNPTASTSTNAIANAGTASLGVTANPPKPSLRPVAGVALATLAAQQAHGTLRTTPGLAAITTTGQTPRPAVGTRPDAAALTLTARDVRAQIALAAQHAALQVQAWAPSIVSERLTLQVTVPQTIYRLLVDDFVPGPASVERRVLAATVIPTSLRRLVNATGEAVMYEDIELVEGDVLTLEFNLRYKDLDGVEQIFDLTGYSALTLRCKNSPNDPDGSAFFTGAGSIVGAATNGRLETVLTGVATATPGRFHYTLKGTKAGQPRTLAHGEWIIANA